MPNWCQNTLVLKHSDPAMIKRVETAFAEGKLFEEFIPNEGDPDNWYTHNISEWGTKWDVGRPDGINQVTEYTIVLYFDSAWSPPTNGYERLMEMGFEVEATYHESGMAFCGMWDNGRDDYYEYNGLSVEEVAEQIPSELDECYSISEQVAQYESDEEE